MSPFQIRFMPEGKLVTLDGDTALSDAAAQADVLIDHPCGANANCGKCRVRYLSDAPGPTEAESRLLSTDDLSGGWRLSCQSVPASDAVIEVPAVSRVASAKGFGAPDLFARGVDPVFQRRAVTLPEPELDYQWALEDSLAQQWGGGIKPRLSVAMIRRLADAVPAGGPVTALFDEDILIDLAKGQPEIPAMLGLALDIGSTSLAGALVNLADGSVLADNSVLNPQVRFGADVISRIEHAMTHEDGNANLHAALVAAVNKLLADLLRQAGADGGQVWGGCAAGNPAMLHTFLGVDVRPLGQAPYVGAWSRGIDIEAREIGIEMQPGARMRLLPMIRSNVGADTVAGVLAAEMDLSDDLSLMIDLGTNSEIVLGHRGRLLATSTAAGPAFEGANIRQGMRAAPGAIDRVSLRQQGRLAIHVLGGAKARGICGSALIDAVAVLLRTGVVDESGRMLHRDAVDTHKFPQLPSRIVEGEHGFPEVILASREESDRGVPVMLHALDVRQLQLIKGSILAGAKILLEHWGASAADVKRVLIAGAFGQFVRKTSLLDIGLIPAVDPEVVHFIGNAAGIGARMALMDRGVWRRAEAVRERAEYIELGGHQAYQDAFGEAMGFFDSPAVEALYG